MQCLIPGLVFCVICMFVWCTASLWPGTCSLKLLDIRLLYNLYLRTLWILTPNPSLICWIRTSYTANERMFWAMHGGAAVQSPNLYFESTKWQKGQAQWWCSLTHGSAATNLLGLEVRILQGAWMSVSCECCVLLGRGLCNVPITHPEKPYRVWGV